MPLNAASLRQITIIHPTVGILHSATANCLEISLISTRRHFNGSRNSFLRCSTSCHNFYKQAAKKQKKGGKLVCPAFKYTLVFPYCGLTRAFVFFTFIVFGSFCQMCTQTGLTRCGLITQTIHYVLILIHHFFLSLFRRQKQWELFHALGNLLGIKSSPEINSCILYHCFTWLLSAIAMPQTPGLL